MTVQQYRPAVRCQTPTPIFRIPDPLACHNVVLNGMPAWQTLQRFGIGTVGEDVDVTLPTVVQGGMYVHSPRP